MTESYFWKNVCTNNPHGEYWDAWVTDTDGKDHYCQEYYETAQEMKEGLLKELKEKGIVTPDRHWTPVTESLPDSTRLLLCLCNNANGTRSPIVGQYTKGGEIEAWDDDFESERLNPGWYELCEQVGGEYPETYFKREVTHWMEIPIDFNL